MAKCDLAIEFERSDRRYRPGETVSGKVTVQVNAKVQCNGLTVKRLWHTHGKGNYAEGSDSVEEVVFSGEWWPGETHAYPFAFEVPAAPVSYHGEVLNVDHYVAARADIPWAIDPKAEEDFLLLAGPESCQIPTEVSEAMQGASTQLQGMGAACGVIFGMIFFCAGLIPLGIGVVGVSQGEMAAVMAIPFGGIFMLVGGGIAFMASRKILAERKLGPVEVTVSPRQLNPGDRFEVELRFAPKARIELNEITATLKGQEVVISGSGTKRTTHRHVFHDEVQQLLAACDVWPEEGTSAKGSFQIPHDAAPSFVASDNRLEWSVELHVDIARWPDWQSTEILAVAPVPAP